MATSDVIYYGEPFYMLTTPDSILPGVGVVPCRTHKAEPYNLLSLSSDIAANLKLKFVSVKNKMDTGPVHRNHEVYIALHDEHDRMGTFKKNGGTSNNFKFKCNKYITVDTGESDDTRTSKMNDVNLTIKDRSNNSSSASVTYGSENYIGSGSYYFAFCDDITNSASPPGCVGPAVAWKSSNGDGSRLKFIFSRFADTCVDIAGTCNENGLPCCQQGQGAPEQPDVDFVACINQQCTYCNSNGTKCDEDRECCSGICNGECVPFLDLGDPCVSNDQCGGADTGMLCHEKECTDCDPDPDYEGPLKCMCLARGVACEMDGPNKCCDSTCVFNTFTGTHICGDDLGKEIPFYAWLIIAAVGVVLILLVYFMVRVSTSGSEYLSKKRKAEGLAPPEPPKKTKKTKL